MKSSFETFEEWANSQITPEVLEDARMVMEGREPDFATRLPGCVMPTLRALKGRMSTQEISLVTGMSTSGTLYHLHLLEERGLVERLTHTTWRRTDVD